MKITNVGPCLGFKSNQYLGYFSTGKIAAEEGCDLVRPIEKDCISENDVIFFVKIEITTFFDDTMEFIEMTHSTKESLARFPEIVSEETLQEFTDRYLESLTDEERSDIGETIEPDDVIMEVNLMSCVAYPDEY